LTYSVAVAAALIFLKNARPGGVGFDGTASTACRY
jgi:hypothetical protein